MAEITKGKVVPEDHRLPPGDGRKPVVGKHARTPSRDPDALRREIEETRDRMSRTLDALEDRLVRQKEDVVARVTFRDLRRRFAESPMKPLLIAFAAGYIVAAIRD